MYTARSISASFTTYSVLGWRNIFVYLPAWIDAHRLYKVKRRRNPVTVVMVSDTNVNIFTSFVQSVQFTTTYTSSQFIVCVWTTFCSRYINQELGLSVSSAGEGTNVTLKTGFIWTSDPALRLHSNATRICLAGTQRDASTRQGRIPLFEGPVTGFNPFLCTHSPVTSLSNLPWRYVDVHGVPLQEGAIL
jgi:hypothetical protein